LKKEIPAQANFFQRLRWRLSCFTEEELDAYLIEEADTELCNCIENDPDYVQWREKADASFSEKDEAQVQEILGNLRTLVFCWDQDREVIKDGLTGEILLVVSDTTDAVLAGAKREIEPQPLGRWKYSLSPNQGEVVVTQTADGSFTLHLKSLPEEYNDAHLMLQGKIASGVTYQEKKPVRHQTCVWKNIPAGEYTIALEKEGTPLSLMRIHLEGKP
jgi:hypothetical protein